MDGIILVDKPAGWTSHDVVAKVRGLLRQSTSRQSPVASKKGLKTTNSGPATPSPKVKVGHTGTLDPFASGLLILVVGSYTKRAAEFSKLDKVYDAEVTLGSSSTTGDPEGEISKISTQQPSTEQVQQALNKFVGEIMQKPPAFSAIKVAGKRAYELARKGKSPLLEARPVTIYDITDVNYDYPKISFTTKVSSGTYIRSLAADIGQELGTGAYLSALRRTLVGQYDVSEAAQIADLTPELVKTV